MKNTIKISLLFVLLMAANLYGQTGSITGTVVDASDDTPLLATNILIAGTSNGTHLTEMANIVYQMYRLVNKLSYSDILVFKQIVLKLKFSRTKLLN